MGGFLTFVNGSRGRLNDIRRRTVLRVLFAMSDSRDGGESPIGHPLLRYKRVTLSMKSSRCQKVTCSIKDQSISYCLFVYG
jgi:hypothetical protein